MLKAKKKFTWSAGKIIALAAVVAVAAVLAFAFLAPNASKDGEISETPSSNGEKITVEGEFACLPKGDGPQTLECAIGIKTDDDAHYGLDLTDIGGTPAIGGFNIGERARITGVVEEDASVYLSEGTIIVESFEKL